jgi:predicted DNA-binding protein (UPF0251 family)
MSRPVRSRKLKNPPKMSGFKPFGMPRCETVSIKLQFDEYESFHLVNYLNLHQDQAAERMKISRPTFTRIYNSALKKIAQAFAECCSIEIAGGNVEFEKQWYKCKKCFRLIDGIENHIRCENCLSYNENELINLNQLT